MALEDEIQQSTFKNPVHKAVINIMFTSNWLTNRMRPLFKQYGITEQQYYVLRILRGRHPELCAARDIKMVMLDKTPDLTRLLDRLVKKGWVSRVVCKENRRKLDILITGDGLELLSAMDPEMKVNSEELETLSPEEAEMLSHLLDKLRG